MHLKIFFRKMLDSRAIQSIRRGLVTLIPILMIGAFSLVLKSLPVTIYQSFITEQLNGAFYKFFEMVYQATFGLLAIYMAVAIGYHYGILASAERRHSLYGTILVSLACFGILSGFPGTAADSLGAKGMSVAIIASCLSCPLYVFVDRHIKTARLYADGVDARLSNAIGAIKPILITVTIFAAAHYIMIRLLHVESFYSLLIDTSNTLFEEIDNGMAKGFLFVMLSTVLWFFGIHGSDMLEGVATSVFSPAVGVNSALVSAGLQPTEILTKPFFDSFVLLGGCGSTLCLLLALLMFGKRRGTVRLARISVIPMLFNINEIMVFGLPVIYNPIFVVPFLCVPAVTFLISYLSMYLGLVPLVTRTVEWTTPIFINGYLAVGSFAGVLLQIVNLAVGTLIYRPFVKMYDNDRLRNSRRDYEELVDAVKESEQTRMPVHLNDVLASYGWMAKALSMDLEQAMVDGTLSLSYQPQYRLDGSCLGAEALLRWNHPSLGIIYPPLVFQLALETGKLTELEEWVVGQAAEFADRINSGSAADAVPLKISANVTGTTMQNAEFEEFLSELAREKEIGKLGFCLELTEQAALLLNDRQKERFARIHEMGYHLAVDDFSMGSTSIQYLIGNYFDLVKLDGGLVGDIRENPRCRDIISSIVQLSNTLGFAVIAEYVGSRELRDELADVGCTLYQGWFYSKALPAAEFESLLKNERDSKTENRR